MWLNACGLGVSCLRVGGFRVQSLSAASDGRLFVLKYLK